MKEELEETEIQIEPADYGVTPQLFTEWRKPRFGKTNPTKMNNSVWSWLVSSQISAYEAVQRMGASDFIEAEPTWCFDRFGQSCTTLKDRSKVFIAGEHEDSYDPDFHIYNDVVVIYKDGSVEIYGYPENVFPPTDFHSATLIEGKILLIGSLSYPEKRRVSATQVLSLDLKTFEISHIETYGDHPGWIHSHYAELADSKIKLTKGKIYLGEDKPLVENIDDWQLDLSDFSWTRLTERDWRRWEL